MNQYMSDSRHQDLDPKILTLDPLMQARDVELIKDKRVRSAQEIKQKAQDKEILDDLHNGLSIRSPITVFVVDSTYYVVDGFHRTGACLQYLKDKPDADMLIPALVIDNRTYQEAFAQAQEANKNHGVGVTADEALQAQFRKLIINGDYALSVSKIRITVGCSQGQAAHIAKCLKKCGEFLSANDSTNNPHDFKASIENLSHLLGCKYPSLTSNSFDSKGFPKVRQLSDAISDRVFMPIDDADREKELIESASTDISKIIERYGEDFFREGLRKYVRQSGLGISITKRDKWLQEAGSMGGDSDDYNPNVITSSYDF